MSQTVKAIRVDAFGGPEVLKMIDLTLPEVGEGQALVPCRITRAWRAPAL